MKILLITLLVSVNVFSLTIDQNEVFSSLKAGDSVRQAGENEGGKYSSSALPCVQGEEEVKKLDKPKFIFKLTYEEVKDYGYTNIIAKIYVVNKVIELKNIERSKFYLNRSKEQLHDLCGTGYVETVNQGVFWVGTGKYDTKDLEGIDLIKDLEIETSSTEIFKSFSNIINIQNKILLDAKIYSHGAGGSTSACFPSLGGDSWEDLLKQMVACSKNEQYNFLQAISAKYPENILPSHYKQK